MPKLENLVLSTSQIGDEGAVALAEAVGKGALPELKELVLQHNQIGDEGAKALAEAVGKGGLTKLKQLWLKGNKLSRTADAKDAWAAVKAKRSGLDVQL